MIVEELDLRVGPLDLLERLSGQPGVAYVDGVAGPGGRRFAILGYAPRARFEIRTDGAVATSPPGMGAAARGLADPLAALDAFVTSGPCPGDDPPFPLHAAAIGYLSYDLRTAIERLPAAAGDDLPLPRAVFGWYDPLIVYEAVCRRYFLASGGDRGSLRERRAHLLDVAAAPRPAVTAAAEGPAALGLRSNMTREAYLVAIARILDYIAAGDVYQINFAQRLSARLLAEPVVVFGRLARSHPVPRGAYLDAGSFQILSNSPELFLERRGTALVTRPIKGTRRRGATREEDAQLRAELAADPKERAEHVMIVDLERNDLGRICRPGGVRVRDFARVETYPTLHHMVSAVEGTLRSGVTVADILRATFPGGSITGAPKIRAMEIIDALEPTARGVYTGAVGLIDAAGDLHLALAIRTAVVAAGTIHYGAGGGIVADSRAEREYAESLLKAEALRRALGIVEDSAG